MLVPPPGRGAELLLEQTLDHVAGERQHRHHVAKRLNLKQLAVGHLSRLFISLLAVCDQICPNPPGIGECDDCASLLRGTRRRELGIGDHVAERRFARAIGGAGDIRAHRADDPVRNRR